MCGCCLGALASFLLICGVLSSVVLTWLGYPADTKVAVFGAFAAGSIFMTVCFAFHEDD